MFLQLKGLHLTYLVRLVCCNKFSQLLPSVHIFILPSVLKDVFFDYNFFFLLRHFKNVVSWSSSLHYFLWEVWDYSYHCLTKVVRVLYFSLSASKIFCLSLGLSNLTVTYVGVVLLAWKLMSFWILDWIFKNWIWTNGCLYLFKYFFLLYSHFSLDSD